MCGGERPIIASTALSEEAELFTTLLVLTSQVTKSLGETQVALPSQFANLAASNAMQLERVFVETLPHSRWCHVREGTQRV
jgi:hypothetical protein